MKPNRVRSGALPAFAAFTWLTLSAPAFADPNDYVATLDFSAHEQELENKLGAASGTRSGTSPSSASALAWGIGITDSWFSEIYVQVDHAVNGTSGVAGYSWENRLRLTETGRYPVDLGWLLEIENSRSLPGIWQINAGPMLQADLDDWRINLNVLWERGYGGSGAVPSLVAFQSQLKWLAGGHSAWGWQALGNSGRAATLGATPGTSPQVNAGPAWFVEYRLGPGRRLGGNLALLAGLNDQSPRLTLRGQLELEF